MNAPFASAHYRPLRRGMVHFLRPKPRLVHATEVPGVSPESARIAMELLREAPTLSAAELSAYLGITEYQGWRCIATARAAW